MEARTDLAEDDVEVIAVCLDLVTYGEDSVDGIARFVTDREIDLPVVALEGSVAEVQEVFGLGSGVPYAAVFVNGRLGASHEGPTDAGGFQLLVREALD